MKASQVAHVAARGVVPFQSTLRRLVRCVRPYEDDAANSEYCLAQGLEQMAALKQASVPIAGATVLEFGSGWLPLIPMLFHLAGARRLILTDITRLMDSQTISRAKDIIAGHLDTIADTVMVDRTVLADRLAQAWSFDYQVPWRPQSQLASSVDVIISRAVFEHVPVKDLRFLLQQFRRILRPTGAMCHTIDNSDHWEHKDHRLSRINFLRYADNDFIWRLAQVNQQLYQNRLRHSDYEHLFVAAGFEIVGVHGTPDVKCLADLTQLPLANRFKTMSHIDLAILESLFLLKKCSQTGGRGAEPPA